MDFKKHLETAWHTTLGSIASLLVMTLALLAVSAITLGILAPVVMAGYTQSIILLLRERREPRVQDLFAHMNLFLPLLGFGLLAFLAVMIGFLFFVLPGFILILAIVFCCFYMLPLMTDRQMGMLDAVKESYAMALRDNLVDHIAVVVIYIGVMAVGGSTFIGALFTQPLATVFLASVYLEKTVRPPVAPPPRPAAAT